jgi:uncharacterized protein YutE (UPF0331/DUF86 family)
MDRPLVENKLESLRRCIRRIETKCPDQAETLTGDYDVQDILTLNLARAVQLCVDIAMHVVASSEESPPDTMAASFDAFAVSTCCPPRSHGEYRAPSGFATSPSTITEKSTGGSFTRSVTSTWRTSGHLHRPSIVPCLRGGRRCVPVPFRTAQ